MIANEKEKFSSQASPEVLAKIREIAQADGRLFQAIVDEALREYIERKEKSRPRSHVMDAFSDSLKEYDQLYEHLAK